MRQYNNHINYKYLGRPFVLSGNRRILLNIDIFLQTMLLFMFIPILKSTLGEFGKKKSYYSIQNS